MLDGDLTGDAVAAAQIAVNQVGAKTDYSTFYGLTAALAAP